MNDLDFDELLAQEPRTEITLILYKNYGVCCFSRIQRAAEEKGETWDEYILKAIRDRLVRDKMV